MTRKRGRAWLANLALMAASLLVLFVACEIGIRIVESMRRADEAAGESWALYDEKIGYRPRPASATSMPTACEARKSTCRSSASAS